MRFILHFLSLFVLWWLLSGQTSPFLLECGVVVCLVVAWISMRMRLVDEESQPFRMLPRLVVYMPWLLWQVVLSNWDVVKRVWTPGLGIAPEVIKVPCEMKTAFGRVTYANSITLTPGTVTIEAGGGNFLVHALHDEAAAGLESGEMHARIRRVEGD
jgi:multicomponent Na+:H+ antiporter subunit E